MRPLTRTSASTHRGPRSGLPSRAMRGAAGGSNSLDPPAASRSCVAVPRVARFLHASVAAVPSRRAAPTLPPFTMTTTTAPRPPIGAEARPASAWRRRPVAWLLRTLILLLLGVALALAARVALVRSGPALQPWHTFVPKELGATELDSSDWARYVAVEAELFEAIRREVSLALDADGTDGPNRYHPASAVYAPGLPTDWNRSYSTPPEGDPAGAVVLLHGLTDSPYSLRHIAARYRERGFHTVGIRLPHHGTVPGALTAADWRDWMAATRLAVREATERSGPMGAKAPLHIVGFSMGGALAVKYTIDALGDAELRVPDRVILISPMVGITRFAQFAGLAGLPAVLPAFSKAAWLGILPEFNPFKFNSFPVNAARQAHRLSTALRQQVLLASRDGSLAAMPPVLTFQSVMDFTVSTPAIIDALYAHLPVNGSELVLFDVNRNVKLGMLMRPSAERAVERVVSPPPRAYRLTVIATGPDGSSAVVERTTAAGDRDEDVRELDVEYPDEIFSLSHVALPFPLDDPLYGLRPSSDEYGANLGAIMARGERGTLIVHLDAIFRIASNPFFPIVIERIDAAIDDPKPLRPALPRWIPALPPPTSPKYPELPSEASAP